MGFHKDIVGGTTNQGALPVFFEDSAFNDAFGRIRTSHPATLFTSQLEYSSGTLYWDESITAGGSSSFIADQSAVDLTCGTASGDKIFRQTKQYFRYQPGKSHSIFLTYVMNSEKDGLRRRVGYFDENNGIFLEQISGSMRFVRRDATSGSPVDDVIDQSSWSVDRFDGTGPSGITLDSDFAQILHIDMQWLGVGRVRTGFVVDGVIYYAHVFDNANIRGTPYMSTANLPVRYEIENTGSVASSSTLRQICSTVASEGGDQDPTGPLFSVNSGVTGTSAGTGALVPIIAIRPKSTFNGKTNKAPLLPMLFYVLVNTNDALIEVLINPTLTGGSWTSANINSHAEYNDGATAVSGGQRVLSSYVEASSGFLNPGGGNESQNVLERTVLTNNLTTQDTLVLAARGIGGTASVHGSMTWKEWPV